MSARTKIVRLSVPAALTTAGVGSVEAELVRRGARGARVAADGRLAISVVATSRAHAVARAESLLEKALAGRLPAP
jgi:hypothetical protein